MTELEPEDVREALKIAGVDEVEHVDEVEIPARAPDRVLAFRLSMDGGDVDVEEETRHDTLDGVPADADLRVPIWHREDGGITYRFEAVDGE